MSTSETTMIGACAKCGRAIPACICRPAPTSAPLIEAPAQPEPRTPDAPCELCNGPTFGDPGGEGHGLGECVECCPTCKGSGHLGPFTDRPRTPDETLAAWDEMRAELLDAESDSPTMVDLVATVDDMAKRLRQLVADGKRLDWLEEHHLSISVRYRRGVTGPLLEKRDDTLREAIDRIAARAAQPTEGTDA